MLSTVWGAAQRTFCDITVAQPMGKRSLQEAAGFFALLTGLMYIAAPECIQGCANAKGAGGSRGGDENLLSPQLVLFQVGRRVFQHI